MNHQSRTELINNINTQLELLDKSFYNNIDIGLIQHPELCKFANNMENAINTIKINLAQLQNNTSNVRFCLICNYISKIDEGLQNEFIRLRFNQLPKEKVIAFLKNVSDSEQLNLNQKTLSSIQKLYKSDIRSMINFMQSNQNIVDSDFYIIHDSIWEILYNKLVTNISLPELNSFIQDIAMKYNIDKKNIIKDYLNYIIRNKPQLITKELLLFIENLMHSQDCKNTYYINYSLIRLSSFHILTNPILS